MFIKVVSGRKECFSTLHSEREGSSPSYTYSQPEQRTSETIRRVACCLSIHTSVSASQSTRPTNSAKTPPAGQTLAEGLSKAHLLYTMPCTVIVNRVLLKNTAKREHYSVKYSPKWLSFQNSPSAIMFPL